MAGDANRDGDDAWGVTLPAEPGGVAGSHLAAEAVLLAARRYQPLGEIARGGSGRILRARDLAFDRIVALKEPLDPVRGAARLHGEASILAMLQHPSIVPVYDSGIRRDGVPFFAMKLVDGRSLREVIREASTLEHRLALIPQLVAVAGAVAYAHSQSVIHRDLTPANVLIGRFGETMVIDWGLAKRLDDDATAADKLGGDVAAPAGITGSGTVMGTPAYMAPEQARGEAADARTDVYALGAILYHVLAGVAPFTGAAGDVIAAASTGSPEPLERVQPRAPADLVAIVVKAMARQPADRYPSAAQLAEDLVRFQTGRMVAARRYSPIARARRWLRNHRRGVVTTGLAVAGVVVAILVKPPAPGPGARCDGAGDRTQMIGIWDPGRAAAVKARFLAGQRPNATDTFDKVAARLDRYAGEWSAARVEACLATHARGEQSEALLDLRMACLDRLRTGLGALVEVFASDPASDVVDQAVLATTRLAPVTACGDAEALQAAVAPPADPEARATIDRLRGVLARARALEQTGQYAAGLALAQTIVQDAERVHHAPILAEALSQRGSLEGETGDYAAAAATVKQALPIAAEARDDELVAGLWADLIYQVGYQLGRTGEALQIRTAAETALRRARGAPRVATQLWGNLGIVLMREGKLEQARPLVERALDARERLLGPDHPGVAGSLTILASLLAEEGKHDLAQRRLEQALAIYERTLGPDHPLVAMASSNLGELHRRAGNYAEARRRLEHSLAIRERMLGPDHPDVATSLHNLGIVARMEGNYGEARRRYERALAIREKVHGPNHRDVADTLTSLGSAWWFDGNPDEAGRLQERALAIYEATIGPAHPDLRYPLGNLGEMFQAKGRYEDARRMHARALALVENAYGRDHPEVAAPLTGLANAVMALGRTAQAREYAERAVRIDEASGAPAIALAASRFTLARVLWELGSDRTRARSLANQAHDGYVTIGRAARKELAEVDDWLARHGGGGRGPR